MPTFFKLFNFLLFIRIFNSMKEKELYKRIRDLMTKNSFYHQITNKEDKETVINNTFMNIWKKIQSGDLSQIEEENNDYIFMACRTNCMAFLRSYKHRNRIYTEVEELPTYILPNDEDEYNSNVETILERLIQSLPIEGDREFLRLRAKGYTLEEIANEFNIGESEVIYLNKRIVKYLRRKHNITPKRKNDNLYQLIDIETDEVIATTPNKRDLEPLVPRLHLKKLNDAIDRGTIINNKYKIKKIKK